MNWLADPNAWIALGTLTALESVLGIDNIIFISVLVGRLPEAQRGSARVLGLGLAMVTRIALLWSISWIMQLTEPLFTVMEKAISGRDLILIGGGLFLIWKSIHEIHNSMMGVAGDDDGDGLKDPTDEQRRAGPSYAGTLVQIAIIDIVFSLDSVITAVGLVDEVTIMMTAIVIAVGVMMFAAKAIGEFVDSHPTIKILALAFLVVVGVVLILDGFGQHVPKGYIYFAMAFSFAVEMINIRMRRNTRRRSHLRNDARGVAGKSMPDGDS